MLLKKRRKIGVFLMITAIALSSAGGVGFTTSVKATKLELDENYYKLEVGECVRGSLKECVNPWDSYNGKVKWSSSNDKVAAVNKDGMILGKAKGKCYVTAKADGKKYKCKIVVEGIKSFSAKDMLNGLKEMDDDVLYMDSNNKFNILNFDEDSFSFDDDDEISYVSHYIEQSDGSMKKSYTRWKDAAAKKMRLKFNYDKEFLSANTGWIDESNGDLYFIVGSFKNRKSKSILYSIDRKGNLFCKKKLEDCLDIDKLDDSHYVYGFFLDYIGQKDGKVFLSFKDNSKTALVIFDMKKKCFTKQLNSHGEVCAVVGNEIVSVISDDYEKNICFFVETLPEGKKKKLSKGNSILTDTTIPIQQCDVSKYWGIGVNGSYIYAVDKNNYMRMKIGESNWTMLGDISKLSGEWDDGLDFYFTKIIPIDDKSFYVVFYEDNGSCTNVRKIELK